MAILVSEQQLSRKLARSRDPIDWLVLADRYEEEGHPDSARTWRKRGEWWPGVHAALERAVVSDKGGIFHAECGVFLVRFTRKKVSVLVELLRVLPGTLGDTEPLRDSRGYAWATLWMLSLRHTTPEALQKKLDRNLRGLIDYLGKREEKEP